jgi:hypothetical protein
MRLVDLRVTAESAVGPDTEAVSIQREGPGGRFMCITQLGAPVESTQVIDANGKSVITCAYDGWTAETETVLEEGIGGRSGPVRSEGGGRYGPQTVSGRGALKTRGSAASRRGLA